MIWHAVHTLANREERVAAELTRLGIERYYPTYRQRRKLSDREKWIDVPVFPGYLFAKFREVSLDEICPEGLPHLQEAIRRWHTAQSLRGEILASAGMAKIAGEVTDEEIDAVRKLMAAGAKPLDPMARVRNLAKGKLVRVKCGPLTGIEGKLLRHKGKDRLVLALNMIHGAIATEVNIRDVIILEPAEKAA